MGMASKRLTRHLSIWVLQQGHKQTRDAEAQLHNRLPAHCLLSFCAYSAALGWSWGV